LGHLISLRIRAGPAAIDFSKFGKQLITALSSLIIASPGSGQRVKVKKKFQKKALKSYRALVYFELGELPLLLRAAVKKG